MPQTTIKRDAHSLYVRTDGRVYRPVPTKHSLTHPLSVGMGGLPYFKVPQTKLLEGATVNARHMAGTPAARLTTADGHEELWHTHGVYLGKKTTECWDPKQGEDA